MNKEQGLTVSKFDDTTSLNVEDAYRISKVSFKWKEDRIVSL